MPSMRNTLMCVEVFDILPLDRTQIESYVDNIIKLGRFDSKDKKAFLEQSNVLVEKGFLNSFLVLSLLINNIMLL